MKKTNLLILLAVVVALLIVPLHNFKSYATQDSYAEVNLNLLKDIQSDDAKLATVTSVEITSDSDMSFTSILEKCKNLQYVMIKSGNYDSLTFLNGIAPTDKEFAVAIENSVVNLDGLDNTNLKQLNITRSKIINFAKISKLTNLNELSLGMILNYGEIDYSGLSALTNMKGLFIQGTGINDYKTFFKAINNLSNLKTLQLKDTNIQNKDTVYLKANQYITTLNLSGSLISDLYFLSDMNQISTLYLPSYVENFNELYDMPNLQSVYWNDYTEYNVTEDVVNALPAGLHPTYVSSIKTTIDSLISSANLLTTDDEFTKTMKLTKVLKEFATVASPAEMVGVSGNTDLSRIVLNKKGTSSNWASLFATVLNAAGIEAYKVTGVKESSPYVWNIVVIDGKKYAVDIMAANPVPTDYLNMDTWDREFKKVMLRDPLRVDSYRESYANANNLDYNYSFPLIYQETDGIHTTRLLYSFAELDNKITVSKNYIWLNNSADFVSSAFTVVNGGFGNTNNIYNYYDKDGKLKSMGSSITGDYLQIGSALKTNPVATHKIIVNTTKTYEVKLDSNGGIGQNETLTVVDGGKYTGLFVPIRYCYKFLGWFTEKTGGTRVTSNSTVDSSIDTLYAHWEKETNKYLVTLDTNGSGYENIQLIVEANDIYQNGLITTTGDKMGIPTNPATKVTGKKFAGWYTAKDGGKLVTNYSVLVENNDHTLYAHWVDENETLYKITVTNYGQYVIKKGSKLANLKTPTGPGTGYNYDGWRINDDKTKIFDFDSAITSDITLTAQWSTSTSVNVSTLVAYSIKGKYMYISVGTTSKNLAIKNGYMIEHLNGTTVQKDSLIKTGDKISVYNNLKTKINDYTAIVLGDVNADGEINSADLLVIKNHLMKISVLANDKYEAADVNRDVEINSADLFRVRQHLLGTKLIG